jgi:hypothetical protein
VGGSGFGICGVAIGACIGKVGQEHGLPTCQHRTRLAGRAHAVAPDLRELIEELFVGGASGGHGQPARRAETWLVEQVHRAQVGQLRHDNARQPRARVGDIERGGHLCGGLGEQPQLSARLFGLGQRGPALLLDEHPLGDVVLHADEVDQLTRTIEHRGDRHLVPEGRAVPAVVQQHLGDRLAGAQSGDDPVDGRTVGGRPLQQSAVAADDLGRAVLGEPGEGGIDPDQRVVLAARVGDREGRLGGDHGPVAQHLELAPLAVFGARELQERHQCAPVVLGPVVARQHKTGDPEQPAFAGLPLQAGRRRPTPGRVVHRNRLTRHRDTPRHQRQRGVGVAHPTATEVGEPRGIAPHVDVDGQPHTVAGQLDRRGVGVDDLTLLRIDH